jgi:hypothetical protein
MADITVLLAAILAAKKGEEVRGSIHDAIEQCYEDGRAGVNDLEARRLIEQVIGVNEDQDAAIDGLTARVEDLEGGSGEQIAGQTTTDVPTLVVDTGTFQTEINANTTKQVPVTFTKTFSAAPTVLCLKEFRTGVNNYYSMFVVGPIENTITTTGFTAGLGNKYSQKISPTVRWIAFEQTVTSIDTEIVVPGAEDLTPEQIAALIALLD